MVYGGRGRFVFSSVASLAMLVVLIGAAACRHRAGGTRSESLATDEQGPSEAIGTIGNGMIVSRADNEERWLAEIQAQLQYASGALAGQGALADLSRVELALNPRQVVVRGQERHVPYVARFRLTWPTSVSTTKTLVLPRSGDLTARHAFFRYYGATCVARGERAEESTFWHAFRPDSKACPLVQPPFDRQNAVRTALDVTPVKPRGGPAYDRLWLGKKLAVTVVIEDERVLNAAVRSMGEQFGAPVSLSASAATFAATVAGKGSLDLAVVSASPEGRVAYDARRQLGGAFAFLGAGSLHTANEAMSDWLGLGTGFSQPSLNAVMPSTLFVSGRGPFPFLKPDIVAATAEGAFVAAFASPAKGEDQALAAVSTWVDTLSKGTRSYGELQEAWGGVGRVLIWQQGDAPAVPMARAPGAVLR